MSSILLLHIFINFCIPFLKEIVKSKSWSETPASRRAWGDVYPVRMAVTKTFPHISPRAETTLFWRLKKSQWIFIVLSELVKIFVCEISCTFAFFYSQIDDNVFLKLVRLLLLFP